MRSTLVAGALGVVLSGLLLAGCSGDSESPGAADAGPTSTAPVEPAWNPCQSLDADTVIKRLGATYSVRRGTPDAPTCTFVPDTEGDPVVDVNYSKTMGTIEETLKEFGQTAEPGRTTVTTVKVPGSPEARLILDVSNDTLAITGFVRNGLLVQIVNALDPAPYSRAALSADVESLMADLAAGADDSGLTG
jgi:hypothetical protein